MGSDGNHVGFKLGKNMVRFASETGGACGASFPGLAEQCMSQCRPREEHSGTQAGPSGWCCGQNLCRSSLAQPIWCSQTKLGQGCKEPVGAQALFPHLQ